MTPAVQRKLLAAAAAALLGIGCRDSMTARPVADLSAGGVRVTGTGQIQDAASPPSWWDEFNFDVRSDLTGKLVYNEHWYRPDGSYVVLVVDASDPETGITAFQSSSSACSDPTKGAEFDGVSREVVDVLGPQNVGSLVVFHAAVCDNGPGLFQFRGPGSQLLAQRPPDGGRHREVDLLGPVSAAGAAPRALA